MAYLKLARRGSRLRAVFCIIGLFLLLPVSQIRAVVLDNGIDPANLGKGDWIYILSTATSQHGGLDGLMAYEKSQGMNYIILKAGDGSDLFPSANPQFTSNVVDSAHAAGLKIFGYTRSYGTNIAGELAIITNSLSLGADGYIIDAEQEWETVPNNSTAAQQLLQPIKAAFPKRFLGHSPQMYIHFHTAFPYTKFGIFCDVVMPQAYWKSFGITPTQCVADMSTDWRNWQNGLVGTNVAAIKPIVPVAQGYTPGSNPVTAAEITEFCNAIKTAANPATSSGYKSINYFRSELHTQEMWDAIRTNGIGSAQPVAPFVYRVSVADLTDTSATITWVTDVNADSVLDYGLGAGYSNSITNSSLVTSHSVVISGLTQTTAYHFRVRSKVGGSTNVTYSGDFNFTTKVVNFVPDILIDNPDASVVGTWSTGTSSADRYGADYRFHNNSGTGSEYLLYTPTIPQAGMYQVSESHPQGSNRTTGAPYTITYYEGSQTILVNQQSGGGTAGGKFNVLGTYYFQSGTAGSVKVSDAYTDGAPVVMADAVKFVYVGQPAPPNITSQPKGKTVNPGSNVTFTVTASGLAPLTYQWQFNGNEIPGATASSYVRINAQAANAGIYTVVVSNPGGDTESADAVLNVNAALSISVQPVNQSVRAGSNATFTVTATGTAPLSYQWRFNGSSIGGAIASSYTILSAQANDAGSYSVVVSNVAGTVTSSNAQLTVTTPQPAQFELISTLPDGRTHLVITGQPGDNYTIYRSSNLLDWVELMTLVNTNGTLDIIDDSASNNSPRFYRTRQ
jgi:Immunoglobulin domain